MTTTEPLTEREQQALEQMREAQEQGSTLKFQFERLEVREVEASLEDSWIKPRWRTRFASPSEGLYSVGASACGRRR